jgi:hypothetical protein
VLKYKMPMDSLERMYYNSPCLTTVEFSFFEQEDAEKYGGLVRYNKLKLNLLSRCEYVRKISVGFGGPDTSAPADFCKTLALELTKCRQLETLELLWSDATARALLVELDPLVTCFKLKRLRVYGFGCDDEFIPNINLCRFIRNANGLERVELPRFFAEEGNVHAVQAVCQAISANESVTTFDVDTSDWEDKKPWRLVRDLLQDENSHVTNLQLAIRAFRLDRAHVEHLYEYLKDDQLKSLTIHSKSLTVNRGVWTLLAGKKLEGLHGLEELNLLFGGLLANEANEFLVILGKTLGRMPQFRRLALWSPCNDELDSQHHPDVGSLGSVCLGKLDQLHVGGKGWQAESFLETVAPQMRNLSTLACDEWLDAAQIPAVLMAVPNIRSLEYSGSLEIFGQGKRQESPVPMLHTPLAMEIPLAREILEVVKSKRSIHVVPWVNPCLDGIRSQIDYYLTLNQVGAHDLIQQKRATNGLRWKRVVSVLEDLGKPARTRDCVPEIYFIIRSMAGELFPSPVPPQKKKRKMRKTGEKAVRKSGRLKIA